MGPDDALDPLSALAPLLRVTPELQALCHFGAQWASPHDPEPACWAPFHLVTMGACFLDMAARPPVALTAGDIALLPHGDAHVMRGATTEPGKRGVDGLRFRDTAAIQYRYNTDTPEAELICGRLRFAQPHGNLARAALPALIVLRTAEDPAVGRVRDLLQAIQREIAAGGPGSRAICTDLASALLMTVLRLHFQRRAEQAGLLRLLGEPQTARAVVAMLDDPGRSWTLDALAARACSSRATLVRDFRRLAGEPPLAFLTALRLSLACHHLAACAAPLAEIAAWAGYQSPSAFSRAYRKRFGHPPGEARREVGARGDGCPAGLQDANAAGPASSSSREARNSSGLSAPLA